MEKPDRPAAPLCPLAYTGSEFFSTNPRILPWWIQVQPSRSVVRIEVGIRELVNYLGCHWRRYRVEQFTDALKLHG